MTVMSYVNCYFDTLVEPMFQRDEQGREVFFPLGIGSRGRIVPDAATAAALRTRLRQGWMIFFFGWIPLLSVSATLIPNIWVFIAVTALSVVMLFTFTTGISRGLPVSQRRMTIANQSEAVLATYSPAKIVLFAAMSIALALMSAWSFLSADGQAVGPTWMKPVTGFGAAFFGVTTVIWLRLVLKSLFGTRNGG